MSQKKSLGTGALSYRRGLIYELIWDSRPGDTVAPEGFSDTAAGVEMELSTVGRPSNTAGDRLLAGRPPPDHLGGERQEGGVVGRQRRGENLARPVRRPQGRAG